VYEEPGDLETMQELLDRSREGASEHLRSIIGPDRTLSAGPLAERLDGMRVLALSTVSARGRPRVSAVDGHLLKGRWVITTSGTSVKAADMRERPAVSAAYLEGEQFALFVHGDADFLGADHPDRPWTEEQLTRHYGQSPSEWGDDIVYVRIQPRWMVAFAAGHAD
jgi:Pyridoxamine 5'-phosphate oxidase